MKKRKESLFECFHARPLRVFERHLVRNCVKKGVL